MNSKKSIFLIEDSQDIRDLMIYFFEKEGYTIQTAQNGHDALEKLQNQKNLPGVILLDLMMPGMNGFEFKKEQEKNETLAQIPVLIMTADSAPDVKAKIIGAQGYLRKPVSITTLLAVAKKFCE